MTADTEREVPACIACRATLKPGDPYFWDVGGGFLHAECCGPEREGYVNADGEPLGENDPLPTPSIWTDAP